VALNSGLGVMQGPWK